MQWSLPTIDSFEEEGHKSRNVNDFQKLENAKNGFSLRALKKNHSPANSLILAQSRLLSDF